MNGRKLKSAQRSWAKARGIAPDGVYASAFDDNFFQPLDPATLEDFRRIGGSELNLQSVSRPPKLQALHSSAALACNVFDYWRNHTNGMRKLQAALCTPAPVTELRFEAPFPTGLPGDPPVPDLALTLDNGAVWAIESKFTEPFCARKRAPYFKDKYFPKGEPIWTERGLPACGALAQQIFARTQSFRYLDAPQLLKQALGLHTQNPGCFTLVYLYMDTRGPGAIAHRAEIERFVAAVGSEISVQAMSYGELVTRLHSAAGHADEAYFEYLARRYRAGGSANARQSPG